MTDYLTLTEFIPGTKAKAQEVNANFSALKDAVNAKAAMGGDSTQTFNVADATVDSHAVNKAQLGNLSDDLIAEINKTGTKFCVKTGNTTNGVGDLFSYNVLTITPKIGGAYSNLVFSDHRGVQTTISTANTISMSGKADGTYNIFVKPDGTFYTLNNTIYRQSARPTMLSGDIWFDISKEPFNCIKYDGTNDIEFLDMPLGKVTISSSLITSIATFPFNQNGDNVNTQTTLKIGTNLAKSIPDLSAPNYTGGISKAINTTHTAECSGIIINFLSGSVISTVTIDNIVFGWSTSNASNNAIWPVAKGSTYTATNGTLTFYSARGGN